MTTERRYWDKRETMTVDELQAEKFTRIKPVLDWAYERSPYYRRSFDAAGIRPADVNSLETYMATVPFISKEAIIDAELENPPYGGLLTVSSADLAYIFVAPGPINWGLTEYDFDGKTESIALAMWSAGVRPSDIADVTLNYSWVAAGTAFAASYRKVGAAVVPGSIGNTKMHIEAMRNLGVTTLFAFSTFFVTLAETAKEMGVDPRKDLSLRTALIGGELKPTETIAGIEQQWGIRVTEQYGSTDAGVVACECEAHNGMHLGPYHIVEILDPVTHKPVPEGDGGEIVVTTILRTGMPIIRYRSGDVVSGLSYGDCSCGRKTPRLGRIIGRVGNIPKVKGMFIVPRQIESALAPFEGLGRFQMIVDRPQLADILTVRIVAKAEVDRTATKAAVVKALRDGIRITPDVQFVDEAALPEGSPVMIDNRK